MEINKVDIEEVNLGTITTHKAAAVIAFYNPEDSAPYLAVTEVTRHLPSAQPKNYIVHYAPTINIPLYNPITGEPNGQSISINELMALTYSMYLYARTHGEST